MFPPTSAAGIDIASTCHRPQATGPAPHRGQAGCPTAGVRTGAAFVRDGVAGFWVERLTIPFHECSWFHVRTIPSILARYPFFVKSSAQKSRLSNPKKKFEKKSTLLLTFSILSRHYLL
jgi:hypothetical protein